MTNQLILQDEGKESERSSTDSVSGNEAEKNEDAATQKALPKEKKEKEMKKASS